MSNYPVAFERNDCGSGGLAEWYAVHTRSNFEKKLLAGVVSKGIEAYLPVFRGRHRWKDRYKDVDTPAFPGYLFVRIRATAEHQQAVLRTDGAVRILGSGNSIEPIPPEEIDGVRRLLESPLACFAHPFLREGSRLRIKRGPLEGVEGYLVRLKNRNRLVVSIHMLARSVATEVELNDIEVVSRAAVRAAAAG